MKKTKITLCISLIYLGLFFVFSPNVNAESITNFESQVKINFDSSILITETIKYNFGDNERHGIYRYIPINYKTNAGNKSINLDLQSITIDGQDENYEVSQSGLEKNIKIGKSSSLIKGEHTYVIVYKVKKAINYFESLDELYWNITGNGWEVPIENISASIILPEGNIGKVDISCYEGILGSNEKCTTEINNNLYTAKSTRILQSGEGLTIAIDFPKGIVYQPTQLENIINLIKDNFIVLLPFLVFIIMFFIWKKYGKDPKGYSVIIAQYEPPVGMKPTLVGSLVDEKPDFRDITAGLIYLAEQGFVKIKRLEKEWILGSVDYEIELIKNDVTSLEKTEQNILNLFFEDSLVVGSIKTISSFKESVNFSLKSKEIISDLYQEMTDKGYFSDNPNKVKVLYIVGGMFFTVFAIFLSIKLFGIIGIVCSAISGIIVIIFGFLMGKKTKLGAETKDYILGFKLFLSVTETNRLDFHNAPEKNPEQFMQFLPYAIALGVENKWAQQFKDVYIEQPSWYQSNVAGNFAAISFMSHMSDFSKSVNTSLAFVSKSAASGGFGGGGGGFSGGGFGGGGGGSW
jgi:uncharacterized membrane protein